MITNAGAESCHQRVLVCDACGFWSQLGEIGQALMVAHLMTSCSCGAHIETRPEPSA